MRWTPPRVSSRLAEGAPRRVLLLGLGGGTLALVAVLAWGAAAALGTWPAGGGGGDDYHIGVALPLSGELEAAATEMLRGIRMLVDEVNAAGGIHGRPLRLVLEDDGNTPEGAAEVAARFAADERILGVVGHFYSSSALGASDVYDARGLVNVVPVANDPRVTRASDWVFGMLPPTDAEGRFMATYLSEVLPQVGRVAVIHETDAYGAGLAEAFLEEAEREGLEAVQVSAFDPDGPLPDAAPVARVAEAVLIFSQVGAGRELLAGLRAGGSEVPIFLPGAFVEDPTLPDFYRRIEGGPLYVVAPFLYQTANQQATRFHRRFVEEHGQEPAAGAPMAHDAARLLVEAIREAGPDRSRIRDFLAVLRDDRAIHSVSGVLSMDEGGAVDRPLYVTRVEEGHFKVAFTQLLPSDGEGPPLRPVDVAYVGIDHFRVETIDPARFSFHLELFMWVKWQSPGLDTSDIIIINGIFGVDDEHYVLNEDLSGPVNYRAYRIKSTYLTPFDLRRFPFDQQSLVLQVGHRTRDSTELLLVPDVGHFRTDPVTLYDPEWRHLDKAVYSEVYRYPSTFGAPGVLAAAPILADAPGPEPSPASGVDPRAGPADDVDPTARPLDAVSAPIPYFSAVIVELTVARRAMSHLLTTLLPLVLILLLTVALLWLSRVDFSVRLRIGMTSLLAILVFHMTQAAFLPNVGYLTKIDIYFLMAYVWFFLLFLVMIGVYLLTESGRERPADWLNRAGPALVLLIALGGFGWVTWGW